MLMNEKFNLMGIGAPYATAVIRGNAANSALHGTVDFMRCRRGTLVAAELWGLPNDTAPCSPNICAMHIHAAGNCSEGEMPPFSGAGGHYDPKGCPHPAHSGDCPPLFAERGYALSLFYTERFTPGEIIGRAVIIHSQRDDFTTQPAGDSGQRLGCGVIKALK